VNGTLALAQRQYKNIANLALPFVVVRSSQPRNQLVRHGNIA